MTVRTFLSVAKSSSALFITSSNPSFAKVVIFVAESKNVDVDAFNSVIKLAKSEPSYESSSNIFKSLLIPSNSVPTLEICVRASPKFLTGSCMSVAFCFVCSTNSSTDAADASATAIAAPRGPATIMFMVVLLKPSANNFCAPFLTPCLIPCPKTNLPASSAPVVIPAFFTELNIFCN